ncbi:MAG: class I mannose-6-phosphate isomerase [Flavisolibacter sp.]
MKKSNFEKYPEVKIEGHNCISGWKDIMEKVAGELVDKGKSVIVIETYHGVFVEEIMESINMSMSPALLIDARDVLLSERQIDDMVYPFVTDDPVFGYITSLKLQDFLDQQKIANLRSEVATVKNGVVMIVGVGASLIVPSPDLLIYADMPRWEIQLRFRSDSVANLGIKNFSDAFAYQYKRAFFVDWRVCDKHKREIFPDCNYFLDTTKAGLPKMVTGDAMKEALAQTIKRPFRVVPFFDPGPWGGQWLKEICDLDRSKQNFAWGFDCVPEENSLLFNFKGCPFEIPAINLVFTHPKELLGEKVYEAFGAEFPIRFDFLDTMEGGNLSLQVHPLLQYIREKFGMAYTQDESYYFLEAKDEAYVYLGLKEKINPEQMMTQLELAQKGGERFDAEQFVEKWQIKKHDHILIPAGTIHCSGANSVVLEISATPYIFTFKLWDWGRMGLDGKPRPISLEHGRQVIQWNRTTQWTRENIINRVEPVSQGHGWREERTGLDETSFIETRRHWFTETVPHNTNGVVNVLNLIEGDEVIIESPSGSFEPYILHYAETFIVPANVGSYTIRPYGRSVGKECATIKASVRVQNLINYQLN